MQISRLLSRTVGFAGLCAVVAGTAGAQSISPTFISATGAAGDVTYVYQLFLGSDTRISSGDLFTFYDFNGLLNGGANTPTFAGLGGASYAISTPLLGANPPSTVQVAGDDPTQPNVTLTYNGATLSNVGGSQNLGTLTLHSVNTVNSAGDFTAFAGNSIKVSNGSPAGNQGFVSGPNLRPASLATPEPGTWAMLFGMGLSGAAFARRRTRRK